MKMKRWRWGLWCFICVLQATSLQGQNNGAMSPIVYPVFTLANGTTPAALGFVCTTATGTSTPLATYREQTLTTANQNPIRLNAQGRAVNGSTLVPIYLQSVSYRFTLYAAGTGNTCNGTAVGTQIWQQDAIYDLGSLYRESFATKLDDKICHASQYAGATAGAKIAACLAVLPSTGGTVDARGLEGAQSISSTLTISKPVDLLLGAATYTMTASISITSSNVRIMGIAPSTGGGTTPATAMLWTSMGSATVGPFGGGTAGINIAANNVELSNVALRGPTAAAYVSNETVVLAQGVSTSSRRNGLFLRNVEIYNSGSYGLFTYFLDHIRVEDSYFHNIGYGGAFFVSSNHGWFKGNRIETITPGTAGDAYAVSITHYSAAYNLDPNAGTKQATNPFSWDWTIDGNYVSNSVGIGIDCHGTYETVISNNKVYATGSNPIRCAGGSGDAILFAGRDNAIIGNVVDAANADGTASGRENTTAGIEVGGGDTATLANLHNNVVIANNVVRNYGVNGSAATGAIRAYNNYDIVIANNVVDRWGGVGIATGVIAGVPFKGELVGNIVAARSSGEAAGIAYLIDATVGFPGMTGNISSAGTGAAAAEGFRFNRAGTMRPTMAGNNFRDSATQINPSIAGQAGGTDYPNTITVTSGASIDLSALTPGTVGFVMLNYAAPTTITDLTGVDSHGQMVTLSNRAALTMTVARTGNITRLQGGVSWTGNQFDSITLRYSADGGVWEEVARSGDVALLLAPETLRGIGNWVIGKGSSQGLEDIP